MKKALTFQDVLLVPQKSSIKSRSDVDVSVKLNNYKFNSPIIPANMRDIVGEKMLEENVKNKNLCFMHRFIDIKEQIKIFKSVLLKYNDAYKYIGASLGVKQEDMSNLHLLYNEGLKLICVDIAHGHSDLCLNMIKYIKQTYSDIFLIAGNVATGQGALDLWYAGADMVSCGIGSGSICSTRLQAGVGVPQLTAIMDVAKAKKNHQDKFNRELYFISDGGIRNPGDALKSLCFANMAMIGNLFAGSVDTPGKTISLNSGEHIKEYHGSSTHKTINIEGFKGMVDLKPSFSNILEEIIQGIKSGCSYQGVDNLTDLKKSPEFLQISNASIIESGAHDIKL